MRMLVLIAAGGLLAAATSARHPLDSVQPNPNTEGGGVLHDGVLTIRLEAKPSLWHPHGPDRPPMMIQAFAEPGKAALMPGPLLRVPAGTEIHLTVHNSLVDPMTFFLPASVHGGPDAITAMDSVIVAPGSTGTLTTRATVAGNYVYRATTPERVNRRLRIAGLLAGALVVDDPRAGRRRSDHVFVIMETPDSAEVACADTVRGPNPFAVCQVSQLVFTINGRSWPATPRIRATAGDSLHWRVLNASYEVHPMHLHGFYYRVEALTGALVNTEALIPGQMVVTQAMGPFSTMSMSWSPDRPGNWLFHCHFAVHLQPDSMANAPEDPPMRDMAGLALGVNVSSRPGVRVADDAIATPHVRLVAVEDSAGRASSPERLPSMRFVVEENGRRVDTGRDFSPELDLVRGEPVAITVVNHLDRPTSVHWHGIEVEDSYADGVPGFSGAGRRVAPAIAPGDSFIARFTPPRAGTFMYHAHVDEVRQQEAGLEGALIVRNPGDPVSHDEHVFFFKGDGDDPAHPLEIDGQSNPDTVVLRVDQPARLRLLNLSIQNPTPTFWLTARTDSTFANTRDTLVVSWRPLAKDGFELPGAPRTSQLARQAVSMGETYDFEYTPRHRGSLQLEIRTSPPAGISVPPILLIRVPIRVE